MDERTFTIRACKTLIQPLLGSLSKIELIDVCSLVAMVPVKGATFVDDLVNARLDSGVVDVAGMAYAVLRVSVEKDVTDK